MTHVPSQLILIQLVTTALLAGSAVTQQGWQFDELRLRHLPTSVEGSNDMALFDADGDGDLDLVTANSGQNRLYLNDGTGIFADVTAVSMPVELDVTYGVAAGDLDGDGDQDLVFANVATSGIHGANRLLLNTGVGVFTDVPSTRLPTYDDATYAVELSDVDGDGDLDIFFGNRDGLVPLMLNDGSGTFADMTARMPIATTLVYDLVATDVDQDGDEDLVIANDYAQLLLNNGGAFTVAPAGSIPLRLQGQTSVVSFDADGDGDQDLVFGCGPALARLSSPNLLYLNDGAGIFTDATAGRLPLDQDVTAALVAGDVDGEQDIDLVCCSWVSVLNNPMIVSAIASS